MKITDIQFVFINKNRLKAFCKVVIDNCFVIKNIRIIESYDKLIVSMPYQKVMDHCPECNSRNHLKARFCNECGIELDDNRIAYDVDGKPIVSKNGKPRYFDDCIHPISQNAREYFDNEILDAYEYELKSKQFYPSC